MKFQVTMEFDESVLPTLRKTPGEFAGEIKLLAAAKWYELGILSQKKAARITGMSRLDFLSAISRLGVTPFQRMGTKEWRMGTDPLCAFSARKVSSGNFSQGETPAA